MDRPFKDFFTKHITHFIFKFNDIDLRYWKKFLGIIAKKHESDIFRFKKFFRSLRNIHPPT